MKRREFTRDQKAAIARRATVEGTTFCEGCGLAVTRFEIDHIKPEALELDKSKKLTIEDGQVLGRECCHRGRDGKTAEDVKRIAKAKRQEAKHLGITRSKQQLNSRGFPKVSKPQKINKQAVDAAAVSNRGGIAGRIRG